ncbi:MAG: sensor histidine kinase [Opitutaceae bacterium]|nr:sensor histidine kinase [Opitutaceae bacterium]
MARDPSPRRKSWLAFAGVAGAWLLFALSDIAIDWAASVAKGKHFDVVNIPIWSIGWVLWIGGSYGTRWLVSRFPIERHALLRSLVVHLVLCFAVVMTIISIEYGIIFWLERTWPETVLIYPAWVYYTTKFHLYVLVYWLLVGVCGGYDYYRRLQRSELTATRLEAELAQAELQALRMQLHPHFLFNTHHSIVSLMLNKDNAAAIKMLTRLSDLLRITLKRVDQATSSLGEELQVLELYLGIQRERYRDRLAVESQVDAGLLGAEVPSLLLQPLVENAIEHGIDPQTTGGRLVILAKREGDELVVTIRDNGPGFPEGFSLEADAGVGLGNTRARLQRLYGDRARLSPRRAPDGGAEVEVALPFRGYVPPPATTRADRHLSGP